MNYFDYYGVPLPKFDDGSLPLGCVVTMKVMDKDGHIGYREFKSPDIHAVEALGMLDTFSDTMRQHIMNNSTKES